MAYGPLAPRSLPEQDVEKLNLCIDRWWRGSAAMQKWAEKAKEAVDFVEGRHWTEEAIKQLAGRPALTINKVNRLVRLMLGYFENNRTDVKFLPGSDGSTSEDGAKVLTALFKQASEANHMPYVDVEVFMDGLMTGRGFYDSRMCFEDNDFGDAQVRAKDPFSVVLDPDGQGYDLNESCSYVGEGRMACLDEIEVLYGKQAREQVEPFAYGRTPIAQFVPGAMLGETTPMRRFGQSEDDGSDWWDSLYNRLGAFSDPLRKSLRIMDLQYQVLTPARMFVDLETGDRQLIPEFWNADKINRVMYWAQQNAQPLTVVKRPVRRVRWTTIIGDLIVYDAWSMYKTYTLTPYFPYFRRGVTRGMVEDLIDPSREINKSRSARVDTVMRVPHSGWKIHENALDPVQERALKNFGSEAGFTLKWKGQPWMEPKKIEPSNPPRGLMDREASGADDLHEISGINESALGEIDIGQSGRAIEARQRQAVISVQHYMTNFSRSKELLGVKFLELVQGHYTEARTFRNLGENGQPQTFAINQPQMPADAAGVAGVLNDVTIGKYSMAVDERPLSATFASAQFEEMKEILGALGPLGQMLAQMRPDLIIDQSSLPRKEEWKQALMNAVGAMNTGGQPPGTGPATPPAGPGGGVSARPPSTAPSPPGAAAGAPPPPNNVVALR